MERGNLSAVFRSRNLHDKTRVIEPHVKLVEITGAWDKKTGHVIDKADVAIMRFIEVNKVFFSILQHLYFIVEFLFLIKLLSFVFAGFHPGERNVLFDELFHFLFDSADKFVRHLEVLRIDHFHKERTGDVEKDSDVNARV